MAAHENKMFPAPAVSSTNTAERRPFFQPKLTVNEPGDKYEQEADAMANKVMRMQIPASQNFFNPSAGQLQRKCKDCEEDQKMLHRKEDGNGAAAKVNSGLDSYVASLGSSGQPLPDVSRQFFEPRFGHDFSNVRIHTNSVAAKSAQAINALAYTTGNNIVFNQGQYAPGSASGQKLMAHELTHVVQQGGAQRSPMIQKADTPPAPGNQQTNEAQTQQQLRCRIKRLEPGLSFFNDCPPEIKTDVDDNEVLFYVNKYLAEANGDYKKAQTLLGSKEIEDPSKCNCCNYSLTAADHYLLIRGAPYNAALSAGYSFLKFFGATFTTGTCPTSLPSSGVAKWELRAFGEQKQGRPYKG